MPKVARIGDSTSHGGMVLQGSAKVLANGVGVARVGDSVSCPVHGVNSIVQGSSRVLADGRGVAYDGCLTACGATLISGSANVEVSP